MHVMFNLQEVGKAVCWKSLLGGKEVGRVQLWKVL